MKKVSHVLAGELRKHDWAGKSVKRGNLFRCGKQWRVSFRRPDHGPQHQAIFIPLGQAPRSGNGNRPPADAPTRARPTRRRRNWDHPRSQASRRSPHHRAGTVRRARPGRAGRSSAGSIGFMVIGIEQPRPLESRHSQHNRVIFAAEHFRSRVSILPRIGSMFRSGRKASNCERRRRLPVPTRADRGSSDQCNPRGLTSTSRIFTGGPPQ